MTEKLIQKALLRKFYSHKYKFVNVFFFENESDFLSFLPNGYCYEVEIKISRSDFKADFKKQKHVIHESNGKKYYTIRGNEVRTIEPDWDFCRNFPELVIADEHISYRRWNETDIRLSFTPYCRVDFREFVNDKLPNKFFYAVPVGLISKNEVPDYAGLLYVDENLNVTKVKDGRFIHRDLLNEKRLFNKAYYAYERELTNKLNT